MSDNYESHLDLVRITKQDIDQEVELLKLQGVENPSRALIYKRLSRAEAIFDEIPLYATPLFAGEPAPDPLITETLVNWALSQTAEVTRLVLQFLEQPSDDSLPEVLRRLKRLGIQIYTQENPKPRTLTQLVLESLSISDQSVDTLYELARRLQPSQRPEAAVRQILRRLKRNGKVSVARDIVHLEQ